MFALETSIAAFHSIPNVLVNISTCKYRLNYKPRRAQSLLIAKCRSM